MTNKEKFLALVSKEKTDTLEKIQYRIQNRAQLRESKQIAWKVIDRLDELGWSQKMLAKKMEVSPQQVNKIVKGQENLTLATLVKLQEILTIPLLASFHENAWKKLDELIAKSLKQSLGKPQARIVNMTNYTASAQKSSSKMVLEEGQTSYGTYSPQVG